MTGQLVWDETHGSWGHATALFDAARAYRYVLTRRWDGQRPWACFLMLNPSTADALALDNTVRRCVGYAQAWGCGGLIVLNAFAFRSTDPKALYGHPDPVGPDNDQQILKALETHRPAYVVAGWGHHARKVGRTPLSPDGLTARQAKKLQAEGWRSRATEVHSLLADHSVQLRCLAVTQDGDPGHPLFLPKTLTPIPWSPR